jgi:hypothetical protein
MKKILIALCCALLAVLSCNKGVSNGGTNSQTDAVQTASNQPTRQLIRTGEMALQVDSIDSARLQLDQLVNTAKGWVLDTRWQNDSHQKQFNTVLRIPASSLERVVTQIATIGKVSHAATQTADVSKQWTDGEARLINAKAMDLSQLLEIERALGAKREEIEIVQREHTDMGDQIAMASLRVSLTETPPAVAERSLTSAVGAALTSSIAALAWVARVIALLLVTVLPWTPLALVALLLWRWGRRATLRH